MSLSKAKDRERKRQERAERGHSRLDFQLRITPEIADFLEQKAGNRTVEEYLIGQFTKAARLHVQPKRGVVALVDVLAIELDADGRSIPA